MRRIGSMLPKALGRNEVLRTARAQAVLRRWPEIVGENLALKSWPDRYDHGTVWVAVTGSTWAQELRMHKTQILKRLAEFAGEGGLFLDVRFGVRNVKRPEQQAESVQCLEQKPYFGSFKEWADWRLGHWPDRNQVDAESSETD